MTSKRESIKTSLKNKKTRRWVIGLLALAQVVFTRLEAKFAERL